MTSTMTTVGYGDFSAAKSPFTAVTEDDYDSPSNMVMIMFIQLLAIFTFTIIKDKIFSLSFDVKLDDLLVATATEAGEVVKTILFNIIVVVAHH